VGLCGGGGGGWGCEKCRRGCTQAIEALIRGFPVCIFYFITLLFIEVERRLFGRTRRQFSKVREALPLKQEMAN